MGLFSAVVKGLARSANDTFANHQRKKAKKIAYKNTGKKIEAASKHHKKINGSQTYKQELKKQNKIINTRHQRINNFIGDY
ncbi:MAG: hypothetical protein IJV85_04765 [Clostridia bacterium]|nr:hypothetical protein [Clostridia bacterium]